MSRRERTERPAGVIDRKFSNQLAALRSSAKAFDEGDLWEAERISAAVQTLCHTAGQSVGLLDQLNLTGRHFLDSATPFDKYNKVARCTLVSLEIRGGQPRFRAELDERPMRFVTFQEWWNAPVLTDGYDSGNTLTRAQLTQIMRNQDGGGHVDPMIDAAYQGMIQAIGFSSANDAIRTSDGELYAMRQIGHEVLKSLIPTYRRRPLGPEPQAMWRELSFREADLEEVVRPDGPGYIATPPLDPCGCGSGRKFKVCHAEGAQEPVEVQHTGQSEFRPPEGAAFARIVVGHHPA
jgi:hypothetical protein